MRRVLTGLILILTSVISTAQTDHPNFQALINNAATDTQKLIAYRQIFDYFKNSNEDSAKVYLEQGLQRFTDRNYLPGKASMLGMLCGVYDQIGFAVRAQEAGEQALAIYTSMHNEPGIAKAHNALGVVEGRRGQFQPAVGHFLKALQYFERVNDTPNLISTYIKLGTANDFSGNNNQAKAYLHKALDLAIHTKKTGNTAYLYNNMGVQFAKENNYDSALYYFQKSLDLAKSPELEEIRLQPLMNIGRIYAEQNNHKKALEYYNRSLAIAKEKNLKEEQARVLQYVAQSYFGSDVDKATDALAQAYVLAKSIDNKLLRSEVLNSLAHLADTNGDYKDEVAYLRKARELHDSIFTMDKMKEIANLQAQYELNKSNTQLDALRKSEQRNLQKKNYIIVIALVLAITLITLLFFFAKSRKLNKELAGREQELKRLNDLKDRLFSIVGHDLRGPIGNIPVLLDIYRNPATPESEKEFILDSLDENSQASIETLDKLLNWGKLQIKGVTLQQSVFNVTDVLNNNLKLLKVTADNKNITIQNKVPVQTQIYTDENHFKFVVRNLLSNAIKYTRTGGNIEIGAEQNDGRIIFSVKDNGIGIDPERQKHIFEPYNFSTVGTSDEVGNSIGLMLCREFIKQNGGDIWLKSEKGQGTTFYFSVMGNKPVAALN